MKTWDPGLFPVLLSFYSTSLLFTCVLRQGEGFQEPGLGVQMSQSRRQF